MIPPCLLRGVLHSGFAQTIQYSKQSLNKCISDLTRNHTDLTRPSHSLMLSHSALARPLFQPSKPTKFQSPLWTDRIPALDALFPFVSQSCHSCSGLAGPQATTQAGSPLACQRPGQATKKENRCQGLTAF